MARLTTRFVQTAPPGKHGDGDGTGLMLVVQPSGSRSYVQRVMIHGKQRDIGIGSTRWTTLAEARKAARDNQRLARRGGDPTALRAGRHVPTFGEGLEAVLVLQRRTGATAASRKGNGGRASGTTPERSSRSPSPTLPRMTCSRWSARFGMTNARPRGESCNGSARCSGGPWPAGIGPILPSRRCGRRSRRMAFNGRTIAPYPMRKSAPRSPPSGSPKRGRRPGSRSNSWR